MIDPFPNTIDRVAFGWYLSGLTDGEGCFSLLLDERTTRPGRKRQQVQPTPSASFAINLRRDDDGVLKLIQSYLNCGLLVYGKTRNMCSLKFRRLDDIARVVKHFEDFPLFAKKKTDFVVWRDGVRLILLVSRVRQKRSRGYTSYKWTTDAHSLFVSLKQELEDGRKFKEVLNEEGSVCNPPQSLVVLDPDVCSEPDEESAAG